MKSRFGSCVAGKKDKVRYGILSLIKSIINEKGTMCIMKI